jgi:cytochrome c
MLIAVPAVASAQDAAAGKKVFAKYCSPCHNIGAGAKNKVGPELNGVIGRKVGSVEGFAYSDALKASGITWDAASLNEWVTNPKAKVAGTKMLFAGIKDETERDDLVAYLSSVQADGSEKK